MTVFGFDVRRLYVVGLAHSERRLSRHRHVGAVDKVHQTRALSDERPLFRHNLYAILKNDALVGKTFKRSRHPRRRHFIDDNYRSIRLKRRLEKAR